jgi:hypothetical protein
MKGREEKTYVRVDECRKNERVGWGPRVRGSGGGKAEREHAQAREEKKKR